MGLYTNILVLVEEVTTTKAIIIAVITMVSTLGGKYIVEVLGKKSNSENDVIKAENERLKKESEVLNQDIIKLTEQLKSCFQSRKEYEEKINTIIREKDNKIAKIISDKDAQMVGIMTGTNLVLGHVTDAITDPQQKTLLLNLKSEIIKIINNTPKT